jgi:hypothetical protein
LPGNICQDCQEIFENKFPSNHALKNIFLALFKKKNWLSAQNIHKLNTNDKIHGFYSH